MITNEHRQLLAKIFRECGEIDFRTMVDELLDNDCDYKTTSNEYTYVAENSSVNLIVTKGQVKRAERNDKIYKAYKESGLSINLFVDYYNSKLKEDEKPLKKTQMYNIINQQNGK